MAASHQNTYVLNVGIERIINVIKSSRFSSYLNIEMKSENPAVDGVWYRFHHGGSFSSWGEKITITLNRISNVSTSMIIHSECGMPTQVIDWGKNQQNVCNIYEYIERELATNQYNAPSPSFVAPTASPSPATEVSDAPAKRFCTNCGNKVSPDDVFCTNCGTKLK